MNKLTFKDIFEEYWVLYRGQATSIPTFGDREYGVAIRNCNNAIKKWERADGQLWRELRTTLQSEPDGDKTIVNGKILYDAPDNMRKPPGRVFVYGNGEYNELFVIDPKDMARLNELSSAVTFIGGANTGFKMQTSERVAQQMNGKSIDYVYDRSARLLPTDTDPSNILIDMSNPTFAAWHMLKLRAAANSNGFMFRQAESESTVALMDMKIENENGTWDNPPVLEFNARWGVGNNTKDII